MRIAIISSLVVLGATAAAHAQAVTDPGEIAARLRFWAQEADDPVYYGEVRNVNPRSGQILGHYQCLALAFIKYDAGVFQYAHKMWAKSPDGSCHYDDVTSLKVGNHGACVRDTTAGFGRAIGSAQMSKSNIDHTRSIFRTIDVNTRRVGEVAACVPPKGVAAGLAALKIENGRLRVVTNRPLLYEVSIDAQDPRNPPSKPVF